MFIVDSDVSDLGDLAEGLDANNFRVGIKE